MNSKLFTGLLLLISFTIGCSEDDDVNSNCRIVTVESSNSNSTGLQTFNYGPDGRVATVEFEFTNSNSTTTSKADLVYDDFGRLIRIFNNDSLFTDIQYGDDTLIVSRPLVNGNSVLRITSFYLLDAQNRITDLVNAFQYQYNDQNQIEKVLTPNGQLVSEWFHDQNQNPLEGIFATANITSTASVTSSGEVVTYFDFDFLTRGPNNALGIKNYINGNLIFDRTYEPEYNSEGLPVRLEDLETGEKVLFTYECL